MQIQEFKYLLKYHPFIEFSKKIGLHINYEGLAQHYGLQTDLIDLTQDFDTAAFFACCKFNDNGNWEPMSDGNGIIYRVDITRLSEDLFKLFEIVGLNVFPRPGEQKAWSFKIPLGVDFEQFGFEEFEFKHDHELSKNILKEFNLGNSLFPFDLIADKVDTILNHNSIPFPVAENVLLKHKLDSAELDIATERYCERFENQFGISIDNRALTTISENEIIDLNKQIESKKENFLKKVGVRTVKNN
jgi:FRG domain